METVSDTDVETTRKTAACLQAVVLQRLADVTQERAAACMGVSASTVSRAITDDLERICQIVAALGLQLTTTDCVVVDPADMRAMERLAFKYLQAKIAGDR